MSGPLPTWKDVEVGDTVRGKDGKGWAVESVVNKDKGLNRVAVIGSTQGAPRAFTVTVKANAPVDIMEKGAPTIKDVRPDDLAAAVVTSTIRGEVILRSDDSGLGLPPSAPKTFQHVGSLLGHLYIEHGIRDLPTPAKAAGAHDDHHESILGGDPAVRQGYRDHVHDL